MFPLYFLKSYYVFYKKKFDYLIILFGAYIDYSLNCFAFCISLYNLYQLI